jgi:hypothetical protein
VPGEGIGRPRPGEAVIAGTFFPQALPAGEVYLPKPRSKALSAPHFLRAREEAVASAVEFMELHNKYGDGWEGECEMRLLVPDGHGS